MFINARPPRRTNTLDTTSSTQSSEGAPKKDASKLTTPPNNRHHWDPDKAKWVRRLRDVAMPLAVRLDDQGFEKLPTDGNMIVGPTHQHYVDALVASRVPPEPHGSMSDVNQFKGPLGKLLSNYGSFPVDRWSEYDGDFPEPVEHAVEILDSGTNFIFYPEGRIYADPYVYPLKTGIGRIGMASKAKYAVPVAQHYSKDTKAQPLEAAIGIGASAAVAGAGIAAAVNGGLASGVAGAVGGVVAGALVGAGVGYLAGSKKNPKKAISRSLKWAGAAALGLGVAGAAASTFAPGVAPWLVGATSAVTGVAGLGATYWMTHRPVAHTRVGDPIPLEPYRERARNSDDPKAEWKEAMKLTADFHEALKTEKTALTGIESPYKMDDEGNRWGKQPDGSWVKVHRNEDKEWVPIPESNS